MKALTCLELVELITDYLDGALDPQTRERFEDHVALCPGCADYVEQLRTVIESAGSLQEDHLDDGTRDELLDAFRTWRRA